ncbi:proton-associated sugar transporter A-like [Asterias rubens]|uniref:proton-associated sugar transporter A-like n=1 Tax=Asterias rubens TaxID=7604 RepID=UPI001455120A|nr:proton-associated sugar transporter A-like [Asterias rubens]
MRTRTFSRTRTISTTSSPGLSGESRGETHRSRKDSTLSWTSTSDAILPTGDIIPVPEDTETDRPKRSLWQLISLNLVVLGIEFCYAMETALVIPLLLQMGLPNSLYSLTWLLSPTLGFFLSPVIGTLSDRCRCFWGRRRPFILVLCVGVIIGFTLFLNGRDLGLLAGDVTPDHQVGLILTVIGVVILDFCADSCDSPSKSYIIDVCNLADVDKGLNIRAVLGGLGAGAGYIFNGIDWESNAMGKALGSQLRVVFLFNCIVCFTCFTLTLFSIKEKPLPPAPKKDRVNQERNGYQRFDSGVPKAASKRKQLSYDSLFTSQGSLDPAVSSPARSINSKEQSYGKSLTESNINSASTSRVDEYPSTSTSSGSGMDDWEDSEFESKEETVSAGKLLMSIVKMPSELRWLCLNHFIGWSALVSIFLFYTDYMAEVVYKGSPTAPEGSEKRNLYDDGVQMGCWGMVIFSGSVIVYATLLNKLSSYIAPRTNYVLGQTIYAVGVGCMAIFSDSIPATLALNVTSGVMFATVTTLPYGLLADYHDSYKNMNDLARSKRGLGTDVACLASITFLAQMFVSAILGALISLTGTKITIVLFASGFSFLAAITSALFVVYSVGDPPEFQDLDEERQPLVM